MAEIADNFFGLFNYWVVIVLMMIGFYTVISHDNLVKKLIGLNLFQTAVFVFYISMGKIAGSTAPILTEGDEAVYAHPLPHVLILTAIVVGVATMALGLALVVRIHERFARRERKVGDDGHGQRLGVVDGRRVARGVRVARHAQRHLGRLVLARAPRAQPAELLVDAQPDA